MQEKTYGGMETYLMAFFDNVLFWDGAEWIQVESETI
jgi:hypothetical protein